MASIKVWRGFLGLASVAMLAACVETAGTDGAGGPISTGARSSGGEIEAPDVFYSKDSALWDGRPSLGGIWVASPDAVDPERVVMFNPATGKSITGALFRRERENPGPKLQLSSDAAEALGVLAGMPTEIEVTALRKVDVEKPVAAETEAVTAGEAEASAAADAGAAAVAAAALDAVDAGAAGADVAAGGEPLAEGAVEAKPKTRKEKRAEAKAAKEAAEAEAAAGGAEAGGEAPADPGAVAVTEIESAPLDAGKAEEKAKEPEPEKAGTTEGVDPAPVMDGAAQKTIQIGLFSKEDNSKRAIDALSKIGIVARSKKIEKDGKVFWGVMATGDETLLKKIQDAGFADAYFLK